MAAPVVPESDSIRRAVSLLNAVDPGRFPRLVSRLLQKLHVKVNEIRTSNEWQKVNGVRTSNVYHNLLASPPAAGVSENVLSGDKSPLSCCTRSTLALRRKA